MILQNLYITSIYVVTYRREARGKGEKEKNTHLNVEFQKISRRDKKAFPSEQCKETEENNTRERLEISRKFLLSLQES